MIKKIAKGMDKLDKSDWFRPYAFGLFFGVLFIFLVGIISTYGGDTDTTVTGYVIKDSKTVFLTGNTLDFKIVSSQCEITPKEIVVSKGDIVEVSFTHYDPDPRLYVLDIGGFVEVGVTDRELRISRFIADKKGTFSLNLKEPCYADNVGTITVV